MVKCQRPIRLDQQLALLTELLLLQDEEDRVNELKVLEIVVDHVVRD